MPANSVRSSCFSSSPQNHDADELARLEQPRGAGCCAPGIPLTHGKYLGQQSLYYTTKTPRLASNAERSSGCFVQLWERLVHTSKEWAGVLRKDPRTLVMPLLLMVVLMMLGISAVVVTGDMQMKFIRQEADNLVMDTKGALEGLMATASMPASALAAFVKLRKNYTRIKSDFDNVSDQLKTQANSRVVRALQLAPAGIISLSNPGEGNEKVKGFNLLKSSKQSMEALRAIRVRKLTLTGPMMLVQGYESVVVRLPVFILQNETHHYYPLVEDGLPDVPPSCNGCYQGDSVFWGFATVVLNLEALLRCVTRVNSMRDRGFIYRLSRPLDPERPEPWIDMQNTMLISNNSVKPPVNPRCANASLPNTHWYFCLAPHGGWMVPWLWPTVAMAAAAAGLLSVLAFAVLVARRQHQLLLQSMLPSKVIRQLKTIQHFVESFQMVTILFSDIVGFDELVQDIPPEDIVQLLDEVYSIYDRLVDKHKVYKVETIGDAFMCVGGCPEKDDPTRSASRIAHMAVDMLRHTRNLVTLKEHTSGGFRIGIRIGIASGPVVAAVIGQRMPRYCLFGDTVNTASRMETTGRALSIQVSAKTAELLQQYDSKPPELTLQCRGQVHIKGKGLMTTYWLCPPDLPTPQNTANQPWEACSIVTTTDYTSEDGFARANTPTPY